VLRDLTERVVVASKGRFDRALSAKHRAALGLPHAISLTSDEFMAATLDVWDIPPESATRVNHPAPFPVELPERLIGLYTFADDLVLDPFMGSGSALVAAARTGRRYAGYDLDPAYVSIARARVEAESRPPSDERRRDRDVLTEAARHGKPVQAITGQVLEAAGFTIIGREMTLRGLGLAVPFVATDAAGVTWYVEVSGAFTTTRAGLARTDAVWRSLGRAHVLASNAKAPVLLLTSHLPSRGSKGDAALHAAGPHAFFDALEILSPRDQDRLAHYAQGGHHHRPLPGFWSQRDLDKAALRPPRGPDQ